MVTCMLKLFSFDVYALLESGGTLSFVTPIVEIKFVMLPDILDNPFSVSTPVGDFVVVNIVYKGCPFFLTNRVTLDVRWRIV